MFKSTFMVELSSDEAIRSKGSPASSCLSERKSNNRYVSTNKGSPASSCFIALVREKRI